LTQFDALFQGVVRKKDEAIACVDVFAGEVSEAGEKPVGVGG
jgi:hypothetical protein